MGTKQAAPVDLGEIVAEETSRNMNAKGCTLGQWLVQQTPEWQNQLNELLRNDEVQSAAIGRVLTRIGFTGNRKVVERHRAAIWGAVGGCTCCEAGLA